MHFGEVAGGGDSSHVTPQGTLLHSCRLLAQWPSFGTEPAQLHGPPTFSHQLLVAAVVIYNNVWNINM